MGSNFINLITMSVFKGSDVGDVEGEKGTSKQQLGRGPALNFQLWVRWSSGTADESDEQHRKTSARGEMEEIASVSSETMQTGNDIVPACRKINGLEKLWLPTHKSS